jgi:glucose/arabinose dehydrogenase
MPRVGIGSAPDLRRSAHQTARLVPVAPGMHLAAEPPERPVGIPTAASSANKPSRPVSFGHRMRTQWRIPLVALLIATCWPAHRGRAATGLPAGFQDVLFVNGLSYSSSAMEFAPDGRLFVAYQTGQLRVIKNGTLLVTPFVSLTVNSSGERGLLGVAFDPNFATNKYVYVY